MYTKRGAAQSGRSPLPEVLRIEFPSSAVLEAGNWDRGLSGSLMPGAFAKDPDGHQGFGARKVVGEGLDLLPGLGVL